MKRENVELHAQLRVSAEEIEKNRTEICDLRKKIDMKEVNVGNAAKIANVEEVDVGNADNITEVEQVELGSAVEKVDIGSVVKTTDATLPRRIFQNLPCKTEIELKKLK